ncbi:MAG: uroporphyrinogen-III synthase [Sulfuricurvum sp.]|nr:uroporphyrinogen-III synthase [Sulfuricurvum sp.]
MRPIYLISKTPYEGVIHIPILTISFLNPNIDFAQYTGMIITSKQALIALEHYTFDREHFEYICVSQNTAQAAREAGAVQIETGDGYGKSIPQILRRKERKGKWLYLRPKVIATEWLETARSEGYIIDEAILYETTCNKEAYNHCIADNGILVFTSPSSIKCFREAYKILPTHTVVVIGETTKNAFSDAKEVLVSPQTSVASAVELAQEIVQNSSPF